jgi:bacterioferritin
MKARQKKKVIDTLNKILEMELAGAIHYTHYSFMVFGYNRTPIVS